LEPWNLLLDWRCGEGKKEMEGLKVRKVIERINKEIALRKRNEMQM
jgi:hypothetical protein